MGKGRKRKRDKRDQLVVPAPSAERNNSIEHIFAVEGYSGPLPHPNLLRQFDEVVPGAANRIIQMAESQGEHRRNLETTVISARSKNETMGIYIGGFLATLWSVGSFWLIVSGHSLWGTIALVGEIGALAAVFVIGRKSQRDESREKRQQMVGR